MGNDSQAMFERTTKFYAESATEWQLKLIVWEFFCTLTWSGRARSCVRKRRTHVTRWLRYWARFPERSINPSTCFAMVNTWKHGISQVRLYDPYGPGDVSRYLSKGRFSSAADCGGANTYDVRKVNRADWMDISPGVGAVMREARTVAIRIAPLSS